MADDKAQADQLGANEGPQPEFAFLIVKQADGNYAVSAAEPAPETHDDIIAACQAVIRNLEVNQTAQAVANAMMAVAQQAQQNDRKSKLVVPDGPVKVK